MLHMPRIATVVRMMSDGEASSDLVNIKVEAASIHSLLPGTLSTHGRIFSNANNKPLQFAAPTEDVSFNVSAPTLYRHHHHHSPTYIYIICINSLTPLSL